METWRIAQICGLLMLLLLLVIWLLNRLFRRRVRYPYERRELLTGNEETFYRLLLPLAGERGLLLLLKVRLADIMQVQKETKDYMRYFNPIKAKHTDFVLCDPETLEVLVGIELDDESHRRQDRMERDVFVDHAYAACGIPILHVWNPIRPEELAEQIDEVLG